MAGAFLTLLTLLPSIFLGVARADPYLKLSSNGPAVLDAPITFHAQLLDAEEYEGPFYFRWNDDASPGHGEEQNTRHTVSNWTLTYGSKKYEEHQYTMTVRVYTDVTFFREKLAQATLKFAITKTLNGRLIVNQNGSHDHIVASTKDVTLKVDIHDPEGFLNEAVLQYFWFVNDTNYGPSENDTFTYRFKHPGYSTVEAMVMAKIAGTLDDDKDDSLIFKHSDSEKVKSLTSDQLTRSAPPYVKTGVFRNHIESRTPITRLNHTGDTWLKHGKILNLNFTCDGSGPWTYCWAIKDNPYNVTGNETCMEDQILNNVCNFPVMWYFRQPGISNILVILDNGISRNITLLHVNIYEVHHQVPLSFVVIPISCTLLAIVASGLGFFLFHTFKVNMAVETADFDFSSPEEQLEYKTFWERLRDSMLNAFGNSSSDDVSHVSSVSSRSVQQPVTSIHYGSIT